MNKFQTLQNAVARCVFQLHRRSADSIKLLLKHIQCLPIIYRIKYKLSLITHKGIHQNSLYYLVPLISHPPTTINTITISSNKFLLDTPISITPTQLILVLSHCQPHAIGTHYLPPFVLSHILSPSNVTLKHTTFLKLSHHKLILS